VRDIRNFTFVVPPDTLEEVFQRPAYANPRPNKHFKVENGVKYFNNNPACLVWAHPENVAFLAQQAAEVGGQNDQNQLRAIYNLAKANQIRANDAASAAIPNWVICQRTEPNNTMTEDAAIRYTDEGQKTIDWYETIRNLREVGQTMGYTLRHYHDTMTRWVSFFKPSYSSLISNMDANETA
jgi:hypothetical protein